MISWYYSSTKSDALRNFDSKRLFCASYLSFLSATFSVRTLLDLNLSFMNTRTSTCVSAFLLLLAHSVPLPLLAQSRPGSNSGASVTNNLGPSLNLLSRQQSVRSPISGTITIGGQLGTNGLITGGNQASVFKGQLLTPAQSIALSQSANGGQQVLLSQIGTALGGTVLFTSSISSSGSSPALNIGNSLSSIVVPKGVILGAIGFNSESPLIVAGASRVLGSMYALQTSPGLSSVLNFSNNLTIGAAGLLSSSVPDTLASTGLFSSQNLTLNVANNLTNNGTISSPGNLNLNVNGALTNATAPGASVATMVAQNINILSGTGSIFNSGLMNALESINVGTSSTLTSLNLNNNDGVIKALNAINLREVLYDSNANVNLIGGDWYSKELNINAGKGVVDLNIGQVSSTINIDACAAHVIAKSENLSLGKMNLSGDPFFWNATGAVTLSLPLTISGGADLAVVATTDIIATGTGTIDLSSSSGNSGSVLLVAGARFEPWPNFPGQQNNITTDGARISISAESGPGGKIDFSAASFGGINTSSSSGHAGDVTMFALFGSLFPSAGSGSINLGSAGSISTAGASGFSNGDVTIISGFRSATPVTAITMGAITTFVPGGANSGGNVTVVTAPPIYLPQVTDGSVPFYKLTNNTDGTITGVKNAPITYGAIQPNFANSSIVMGGVVAGLAGNGAAKVNILAGNNLKVNGGISAGDMNVSANSAVPFTTLDSGSPSNGVAGTISAFAADGGQGGSVTLSNLGGDLVLAQNFNAPGTKLNFVAAGDIKASGAIALNTSSTAINGGSITMVAGTKAIAGDSKLQISGPGAGGNIDLGSATSLNSSSSALTGSGADITLIAFGSASKGQVAIPSTVTVSSGGAGSGYNGNVSIFAGIDSTGNGISGGFSVTTSGGSGGNGNITLASASPSLVCSECALGSPSVTISSANMDVSTGIFVASSLKQAGIEIGNLSSSNSLNQIYSAGKITFNPASTITACAGCTIVGGSQSSAINNLPANASVQTTTDVTITSALAPSSTPSLTVQSVSNGNISIETDLTNPTSANFIADGSGSITMSKGTTVSSPKILFWSTTGNLQIGLDSTVSGGSSPASSVTLATTGEVSLGNIQALKINTKSLASSIQVRGLLNANQAVASGNGGSITLSANSFTLATGAELTANGAGSETSKGGEISITGSLLTVSSSNPIPFSANGSGSGSGGKITLAMSDKSAGSINVGSIGSVISISATGGSLESEDGGGGTVSLAAAKNLVIDVMGLKADPQGTNGAGATFSLNGGAGDVLKSGFGGIGGSGALIINGSLIANGAGKSNGGTINLFAGKAGLQLTGDLRVDSDAGKGGSANVFLNNGSLAVGLSKGTDYITGSISSDSKNGNPGSLRIVGFTGGSSNVDSFSLTVDSSISALGINDSMGMFEFSSGSWANLGKLSGSGVINAAISNLLEKNPIAVNSYFSGTLYLGDLTDRVGGNSIPGNILWQQSGGSIVIVGTVNSNLELLVRNNASITQRKGSGINGAVEFTLETGDLILESPGNDFAVVESHSGGNVRLYSPNGFLISHFASKTLTAVSDTFIEFDQNFPTVAAETMFIKAPIVALDSASHITGSGDVFIETSQLTHNHPVSTFGRIVSTNGSVYINSFTPGAITTSNLGIMASKGHIVFNGGNNPVAVQAGFLMGSVDATGSSVSIAISHTSLPSDSTKDLDVGIIGSSSNVTISTPGKLSVSGSIFSTDQASTIGLLSGKDILINGPINGAGLTAVAGVSYSTKTGVITGGAGGSIMVSAPISTNGGDILAAAFSGAASSTILPVGSVSIKATIDTGAKLAANDNGNLTVIAGATSGTSIQLSGDINTYGNSSSANGGSINLITATPVIAGGTISPASGVLSPNPLFVMSSFPILASNIDIGNASTVGSTGLNGTAGSSNLVILSGRDINLNGTLHVGNITMIAGAAFDAKSNTLVSSSVGGTIRAFKPISTSGGNFVAAAFGGTETTYYTTQGSIILNADLNTGAPDGGKTNGSVSMVAAASVGVGIRAKNIITAGNAMSTTGGSVTLLTAIPLLNPGTVSISEGVISPNPLLNLNNPSLTGAAIVLDNVITAGAAGKGGLGSASAGQNGGNGGNIALISAGYISANSLLSFGAGGGGGGSSNLGAAANGGNGGAGGSISVSSSRGYIWLTGDVNSSGGGGGGGAGSGANLLAGSGGTGGAAGSVNLNSSLGTVLVEGTVFASSGGDGGAGSFGSIRNGGGGGGSFGGGGGGGSSGIASAGGGGAGFKSSTLSLSASGGGGGSAKLGGNAAGGDGGGFSNGTIASGRGGTGAISGTAGDDISGGAGASSNAEGGSGGVNLLGDGGRGAGSGIDTAGDGGNRGSSKSANAGLVQISGQTVAMIGQINGLSISASGTSGELKLNTLAVSPALLNDGNFASNVNLYLAPTGGLYSSGQVVAGDGSVQAISINGALKNSPTGPLSEGAASKIIESGKSISIALGSFVTAAEYLAIVQTNGSGQKIVLTGSTAGTGIASAGSFEVDSQNTPAGGFFDFNLPAGVTGNFAVSLQNAGNAIVDGALNFNTSSANSINSGGTIAGTGIISAQNGLLSITSVSGNLGSSATAFRINGGGSGLSLFASGALVNLSDNSTEAITLQNSAGPLKGTTFFGLSSKGNIKASSASLTALVSSDLYLRADGGKISGDSASLPLLFNSNDGISGLKLYAYGSTVNLKNTKVETITLSNSIEPLLGSSSFSLNTRSSIFTESPTKLAVVSPALTLIALGGNVAADANATLPLLVTSGANGLTALVQATQSFDGSIAGTVNIADQSSETLTILGVTAASKTFEITARDMVVAGLISYGTNAIFHTFGSTASITSMLPEDLDLSKSSATYFIPAANDFALIVNTGASIKSNSGSISINGKTQTGPTLGPGKYEALAPYSITISGGSSGSLVITPSTPVTPAQWVAAIQVQNNKTQALTIGLDNSAVSGDLTIGLSNSPAAGFSKVLIPGAVTAYLTSPGLQAKSIIINGTLDAGAQAALVLSNSGTGSANLEIGGTGKIAITSSSSVTLQASSSALDSLKFIAGTNLLIEGALTLLAPRIIADGPQAALSSSASAIAVQPSVSGLGSLEFMSGGSPARLILNGAKVQTLSSSGTSIGANFVLEASGPISLTDTGSGDLTGSATGLVVSPFISLVSTNGKIGNLGSNQPFGTQTGELTAKSTGASGNSFVTNKGSVILSTGNTATGTWSLSTTPDKAGNGQILIASNLNAAIINLSSSSSGSGSGGIQNLGSGGALTSATVNLKDTGTSTAKNAQDIGSSSKPISTQTSTLTASSSGSIYINNKGKLTGLSSTASSSFVFLNDNSIGISAAGLISIGSVSLSSNANNGSIVIDGSISAATIQLSTNGSGAISLGSGQSLNATGMSIDLTAASVTLDGTINAPSALVTILPTNNTASIGINGAKGSFQLSGNKVGQITADKVVISSINGTGDIAVNGLSANYDLEILSSTSASTAFTNSGVISLGAHNLTIATGGKLTTGGITGTNSILDLRGSEILINSNVSLLGSASASSFHAFGSAGSGAISGSGTISSTSIVFGSDNDFIAANSSAAPLSTASSSLTANAAGAISIVNAGNLTQLNSSNSGSFALSNNNSVNVGKTGLISSGAVSISTTANNGSISMTEGSLASAAAIQLSTHGAGIIVVGADKSISSGGNSDISILASSVSLFGDLIASAGNANVSLIPNNENLSIGLNGGAGTFQLSGQSITHILAGTVTIGSASHKGPVQVNALSASLSVPFNIVFLGGSSSTWTNLGTLNLDQHDLSVTTGAAISSGKILGINNLVALNGAQISIDNSISVGSLGKVSLVASGNPGAGYIAGSGLISAASLSLKAKDFIGGTATSGALLNTAVADLDFNTASDFALSNNGNLNLGEAVATNLNLKSTGLISSKSILASANLDINAAGLTLVGDSKISGTQIAISGISGLTFTLSNSGSITAEDGLSVTSAAGESLVITGTAGQLQSKAGSIYLTAASKSSEFSFVEFAANQTLLGSTLIKASGINQSVKIDSGVAVIAPDTTYIYSNNFINQGSIGPGSVVVQAKGAGTIQNPTGSIDLKNLGNLQFLGQCLTLLAKGDILNTGGQRTIDLSAPNAQSWSGSLNLIAGFDFTPGNISPNNNVVPDSFTLTGPSSTPGKISLANVNITTGQFGLGGDVRAIATGSIALGAIDSSASITGGSITIIGNGISVGKINTSSSIAGAVSIISATPQIAGATIVISKGILFGGEFVPTAYGGKISATSINAGKNGNVLLRTGGSSTVQVGSIASGLLSVSAGSANLNLNVKSTGLEINTQGNAKITNSVFSNLANSNVGGTFTLTAGAGIQLLNSTVSAGKGFSIVSKDGSVTVNGSTLTSSEGSISLTTSSKTGSISIDNGSFLYSGSEIAVSSAGDITIGRSDTKISAGSSFSVKSSGTNAVIEMGALSQIFSGSSSTILASGAGAELKLFGLNLNVGTALTVSAKSGVEIGDGINQATLNAGSTLSISSSSSTGTGIRIGTDSQSVSDFIYSTGKMSIAGAAGIKIGQNASVGSAKPLALASSSGAIQIGNNNSFASGQLNSSPSPPTSPLPLSKPDLLSAGAISITAGGPGGISALHGNSFTVAGGNLSMKASKGAVSFADKTTMQVDGGSLILTASAGPLNIGSSSPGAGNASSLVARTLNNLNGNIFLTGTNGLSLGGEVSTISGASITLSAALKTGTTGGVLSLGSQSSTQASKGLSLVSSGTASKLLVETGATLKSGIANGAAGSGALSLTAASISVSDSAVFESNGADLKLSANNGILQMGKSNQFLASGGNIFLFAKQDVIGQDSNSFHAIAKGSPASSMGGGIEIGAGLLSSTNLLFSALAKTKVGAGINPLPASLGSNVVYGPANNHRGVIQAKITGTGSQINLNSGLNGPSTLLLNKGAQVFDANGGSQVLFDHASFQTDAFKPISMVTEFELENETIEIENHNIVQSLSSRSSAQYFEVRSRSAEFHLYKMPGESFSLSSANQESLQSCNGKLAAQVFVRPFTRLQKTEAGGIRLNNGELFLNSYSSTIVTTLHAEVQVERGALVAIECSDEASCVRTCGAATVNVSVNGHSFALNPGEEIVVRKSQTDRPLAHPQDGLGRRNSKTIQLGSKQVTISDFAIITLLANSKSLTAVLRSSKSADRQLLGRILKTAASVDLTLKHRGAYTASATREN